MLDPDPHAANRARLVAALSRTSGGDRSALREVYDLTAGKLFGICLRICRDRDAAEDVLQDVYLKVWNRAGRFNVERASPITWLSAIARNAAIDWVRSNNPSSVAATPGGDSWQAEPTSEELGAFETLEAAQTRMRLERCLDQLGPQQGGAIRAAFLDGFTHSELAARLSVPLGTMKSLVRRGLLHLRECLGDA
ncbi:MAG: sigma-70 family RNA polymerase sigma factor [Sphingomonadaceae bacterium]|nr:sigma-70 family RNA polymerase sigma factor [Sphingomonadaceae bacterium]